MTRLVLRWLGRGVLALLLVVGVLFITGPYEPVESAPAFDATQLDQGVDAYLKAAETRYSDIRPGNHKRMIWAGEPEAKVAFALVYIHGFSASSEEIRPVPDQVAESLGANLFFTRLRGHGRGSDAMAEPAAADWFQDVQEALAIGQRTGEKVILLGTSTGGTLAASALSDPELRKNVAGAVFVSPNFGINNPAAPLLTLPAARWWLPVLVGDRRGFEPANNRQAMHWTTEYPSVAVFPMAALVKHAIALDYSTVDTPALFIFSDADRVVRPGKTKELMARWGGRVERFDPGLGANVSPFAHVITGDIVSPGNTDATVARILEWIDRLD